jgi:hypothetical protein
MTWGAIGTAVLYAVVSAAVSVAVQAIVTALTPAKQIEGPKLNDLKVQVSTYGQSIPKLYGTVRMAGNIIWSTPILETSHKKKLGKGGGGKAVQTTYTYRQSMAIGLCEGEIVGIRRIWINGELVYNLGTTASQYTILASKETFYWMRIYYGTDDQQPSEYIQALEGVANTPAYRGLAYVVFQEFELADWQNRTPNFEFEVITKGGLIHNTWVEQSSWPPLDTPPAQYWFNNWGKPAFDGVATLVVGPNSEVGTASCAVSKNGGMSWFINPDFPNQTTSWYQTWSDVCWGNGQFMCVSSQSGGVVAFSSDGLSWNTAPIAMDDETGPYWARLAVFGQGKYIFVAGRSSTVIWTDGSFDISGGMIFHHTVLPMGDAWQFNPFRKAIYENGLFIILSGGWTFMGPPGPVGYCYSYDGENWSLGYLPAVNTWVGIAYGNGRWVTVAAPYGDVAWSYDGINWTALPSGTLGGFIWLSDIAFGDGHFIVTSSNQYMVSPDGVTWTDFRTELNGNLHTAFNLIFVKDHFVETPQGSDPAYAGTLVLQDLLREDETTLMDVVGDLCLRSGLTLSDIDVSQLTDKVEGYAITKQQSARAGIEQLMRAYYFDAVESDAKIKFVKRGGGVAVSIPEDDLAAHESGSNLPDQLTIDRIQEMELPLEIAIKYMDIDAAYQIGTQYSRRLTSKSQNKASFEVTMSLTGDKAKQITDVILFCSWTERSQLKLALSNKYAYLEPTDIVSITKGAHTYTARLIEKDEANGVHNYSAVLDDAHVYTQNAVAAALPAPIDQIEPVNTTLLMLLDIPLLRDQDNGIGFYAAACGYNDGAWGGAVLYKSIDGGSAWNQYGDEFFTASQIGNTVTALPDFLSGNIFDENSTVDIRLINNTLSLSGITEQAVLNGGNAALIGNEIIQFKNAALIAAKTYRLSGLLRGRRGTEWAMSGHITGERFVFFDVNETLLENSGTSELGLERQYKCVTFGGFLEDAAEIDFTNHGIALECYSPVQLGGGRDAAGNITLQWKRRSRIGASWNNYTDAQLGEAAESYTIEIYSSNTYVTLKRTLTSTTPTVTYTAAMQITDFGSSIHEVYLKIYQNSAIVGKGYPASAVITLAIEAKVLWRVNITANNGDPYTAIAEMEMKVVSGGSDQCTGGRASASNFSNSNEIADYAFDNNNSTIWATPGVGWLQYDFGVQKNIVEYTIRARDSWQNQAPKDWTLEYFDGNAWIVAHTVTNQTGWSYGELRTFTL